MDEEMEFRGFWARVGATLIDTILLLAITTPLMFVIYGDLTKGSLILGFWDLILNYVAPILLTIALWWYFQATPGKMLLQMVIVDRETGGKPSKKQLIIRYFSYLLSALPMGLGFIWVAFDKNKQGWHDKLSGTAVVRKHDEVFETE